MQCTRPGRLAQRTLTNAVGASRATRTLLSRRRSPQRRKTIIYSDRPAIETAIDVACWFISLFDCPKGGRFRSCHRSTARYLHTSDTKRCHEPRNAQSLAQKTDFRLLRDMYEFSRQHGKGQAGLRQPPSHVAIDLPVDRRRPRSALRRDSSLSCRPCPPGSSCLPSCRPRERAPCRHRNLCTGKLVVSSNLVVGLCREGKTAGGVDKTRRTVLLGHALVRLAVLAKAAVLRGLVDRLGVLGVLGHLVRGGGHGGGRLPGRDDKEGVREFESARSSSVFDDKCVVPAMTGRGRQRIQARVTTRRDRVR